MILKKFTQKNVGYVKMVWHFMKTADYWAAIGIGIENYYR